MGTPIIGITTYSGVNALANVIPAETAMLPVEYIEAVRKAGGRPVLLPTGGEAGEVQEDVEDYVDGVLLPGGPDIDPALYRQEPEPETGEPDTARDAWEWAVAMKTISSGVPLLGISRGMQLINVVLGGDLIQHIPHAERHGGGLPGFETHDVNIEPRSMLGEIMPYEIDPATVVTRHHQAIGEVAEGLTVVATAEDGCPEAVESPHHPFLLGVQWHPERDYDQSVIVALVEAAKKAM